jgi:hypothetical protein
MKKDSKKSKQKAEAKQKAALLCGLAERPANSLVIGIDLGDRRSTYCVRTLDQQVVMESLVDSKPEAILKEFEQCKRQRSW